MSPFRATMMATGASVTFLGISAMLLLTPTRAEERPSRAVSAIADRDALDQRDLLWTTGRPVLTVTFRVSSERIDRHRQLLDQDSILAHGEFDLLALLTQAASQSRLP